MEHRTAIIELDEGAVRAECSCGWRSPVFGTDKIARPMDPLQQADDAADLHRWDAELT